MNPEQVVAEAYPMLDDILGRIGLHETGSPIRFKDILGPFDRWIEEQVVSQDDYAFMVSLVGAFICEFLIHQAGGARRIVGGKIMLNMPVAAGVLREFDPYQLAIGVVQRRAKLSTFLETLVS
jgi:hypothetical protein